MEELVRALRLSGWTTNWASRCRSAARAFEELPWAFFWSKYGDNPGAATKAELGRSYLPFALARLGRRAQSMIQGRFRAKVRRVGRRRRLGAQSTAAGWPADATLRR